MMSMLSASAKYYCSMSLVALITLLLSTAATTPVLAQNGRIVHTTSTQDNVPPQLGREFWFSPVPTGSDATRTYTLYITATKKTTVQIAVPGATLKQLALLAYKTSQYSIPAYSDTSLTAIHVWDTSADLCCTLMSHAPSSGDGMYILPTIAWGSDYAVAAYNAFWRNATSGDFPSEFNIVADQANTGITITPTADVRGPKNSSGVYTIAHAKNVPFSIVMNAGDALQFKTMPATDSVNFDFTGTVIHATAPVGVAAGSQKPSIPMSFDSADHVCEMMLPIRTWGTRYYSAPFSLPGLKTRSTFLLIGTQMKQNITQTDSSGASNIAATLTNPYDHAWVQYVDRASKWESTDPFYIVQYINSSAFAGATNTLGDPGEMTLEPADGWIDTVVFQTPGLAGYTDYVNLFVNVSAASSTLIDNQPITTYQKINLDGTIAIYRITGLSQGTHVVKSSSPVGVNLYGYGVSESYAMTGYSPTATFQSPDFVPPTANPSGLCFEDRIDMVDSGIVGSAIDYIRLDTLWNMRYDRSGTWVDGGELPKGYYTMHIIDSTREAYMQTSVFDYAGNRTTIVSTFEPRLATIRPVTQDFGDVDAATTTPIIRFDTIKNIGTTPFPFTILRLYGGDTAGFSIVNPDMSPLAPGESRIIQVMLVPKLAKLFWAGILFGDTCISSSAVMRATGTTGAFTLSGYDFGKVQVGSSVVSPGTGTLAIKAVNTTDAALVTIDSVWSDSSEFVFEDGISPTNPLLLQHGTTAYLKVKFTPTECAPITSNIHARSLEAGRKDAILIGTGTCADVETDNIVAETSKLIAVDGGRFIRASIPASWVGSVHLDIEDLIGHRILSQTVDASMNVDVRGLSRGVYYYRLSTSAASQSGKVILGE